MSLFSKWEELSDIERTQPEAEMFWKNYWAMERTAYEIILKEKSNIIEGKVNDLCKKYGMTAVFFTGFLDGINSSLKESVNLSEIEEDSDIKMEIIFDKLYCNMIAMKAEWLYDIEQWNNIISEDERIIIRRDYHKSQMAVSSKIGRNDDCPCGSGKKYKKCCMKKEVNN